MSTKPTGTSGYLLSEHFMEAVDMAATGIVEPAMVWVKDAAGKWRPTGEQEIDANGVLMWNISVTYLGENWGRAEDKKARVRVPSPTEPRVQRHRRVEFEDLTLHVKVSKGSLDESFTATGIRQPIAGAGKDQRNA